MLELSNNHNILTFFKFLFSPGPGRAIPKDGSDHSFGKTQYVQERKLETEWIKLSLFRNGF